MAATSTPTDTRPPFTLAVLGSDTCPEPWVWVWMDRLTARVRTECSLTVCLRDSEAAGLWANAYRIQVTFVPVCWQTHAHDRRRDAEAEWARDVAMGSHGIAVFGPLGKWWRVLERARTADIPVRRVRGPRVGERMPAGDRHREWELS